MNTAEFYADDFIRRQGAGAVRRINMDDQTAMVDIFSNMRPGLVLVWLRYIDALHDQSVITVIPALNAVKRYR